MTFKSLNIIEPILKALESKGYISPTPIQAQTIPLLLDNNDVIGIAQTGTGKTAAFTLPIIQKLHEKYKNSKATSPKALILSPTRELAAQIAESFESYGKYTQLKHLAVFGGVGMHQQIKGLQRGVDILIATPGRLLDLMNQKRVDLNDVEFLVLDEADRMLDMGFLNDVKDIASSLSPEKQSLFFSATMSNPIANLTKDFLKNPIRIDITPESTPVEKIDQSVFFIDQENKDYLLYDLMKKDRANRTLVFVGMKHKADRVVRFLAGRGIPAEAIHGNKNQIQRTKALNNFKKGRSKVLVATDIASRGIDVQNISHVVNYDLPNEPENYVHRIGRTARAGNEGTAYSFCSAKDKGFLNQIEKVTKRKTPVADHKYHSDIAKNAEGPDARPSPRGNRSFRRGGARGSFGKNTAPKRSKFRGRENNQSNSNRSGSRRPGSRRSFSSSNSSRPRPQGSNFNKRGYSSSNRSAGSRNSQSGSGGNSRFSRGRPISNRGRSSHRR